MLKNRTYTHQRWLLVTFIIFITSMNHCALAANDSALLERIKEKNNQNWNKIYGKLNYSYMSTTQIKAWFNDDTSHPLLTGVASGVVTFAGAKSKSEISLELQAGSAPAEVTNAANKAKNRHDKRIESFVHPPFMNNVLNVYKLKMDGEEIFDGYDCYIVLFYPTTYQKKYMSGRAWIDKKTLVMVSYTGQPLIPPGFVSSGSVRQDFFYDEKHDAWFPKKMYVHGTVNLLWSNINGYIDSTQTDYKFDII